MFTDVVFRNVVIGFLSGLTLLIFAYIHELFYYNLILSYGSLYFIHNQNNVMFFLEVSPLITGALGFIYGLRIKRLKDNKKNKLVISKNISPEIQFNNEDFVDGISHEIKTPMSGIIGINNLLSSTNLDDYQKDYVTAIQESSEALLSVLNDIMDLSKLSKNNLKPEKTKFNLFHSVYNLYYSIIKKCNLENTEFIFRYSPEISRMFIGDEKRINQVLKNIISNSVQFTKKGYIFLNLDKDINNNLLIKIEDTGIGMSKYKIKNLFREYRMVDQNMHPKVRGTGVGLKVSKHLVELMKGNIVADSMLGIGSKITITLPYKKCEKNKSHNKIVSILKGRRILVLEQRKITHKIYKEIFNKYQIISEFASTYDKLVQLLKSIDGKNEYDFIIIDYAQISLNPLRLVEKVIEKSYKSKNSKLLISYGSNIPNEHFYIFKKSISGFFRKPFNEETIYNTLINLMYIDNKEAIVKNPLDLYDLVKTDNSIPKFLKNRSVLVAEDNEVNLKVITRMLESVGANVIYVKNGINLIESFEISETKFDMIFMDCIMPEMDGVDATKIIRRNYSKSELPIIAITAKDDIVTKELCSKAGMNDFISKPFKPNELYTVIQKWI